MSLQPDQQKHGNKVVIKTPDGKYVGGGRTPEIVDSLSRAYLYEDCEATDEQISVVNTLYSLGWYKVDAGQELRRDQQTQRNPTN